MSAAEDVVEPGRAEIEEMLEENRAELVAAVDGLTEDQARRRLVPSLTTPLGLVKHAAFAERVWFEVTVAGRTRDEVGLPDDIDESFTLTDDDTVASAIADFRAACESSRRIAAAHRFADEVPHRRRGSVSLRWIHLHLIEELARHAGHADILREQIRAADPR